jgi:hypothetical protein
MAQSFGFWRIALSSFVAVFMVYKIVPVISFGKGGIWHFLIGVRPPLLGQIIGVRPPLFEKHKFEDVARLCFFYGLPKVKRVFRRCEFEQMTRACVTRMLGNISKGLCAMQAGNAGDRTRLNSDCLKSG